MRTLDKVGFSSLKKRLAFVHIQPHKGFSLLDPYPHLGGVDGEDGW